MKQWYLAGKKKTKIDAFYDGLDTPKRSHDNWKLKICFRMFEAFLD